MLMCAALPSSSWCLRLERFGEFRISQVKLTCRYRRCGICIVFLSGRIVCRGSVSSRYTRKGEWSRGYVLGCLPSGVWRSRAEGEGLTRGGSPGVSFTCGRSSTRRLLAAAVVPPSSWTMATATAGQRRFSPPSVASPTVSPPLGFTLAVPKVFLLLAPHSSVSGSGQARRARHLARWHEEDARGRRGDSDRGVHHSAFPSRHHRRRWAVGS